MRIIPSDKPLLNIAKDEMRVKALSGVKAAKHVEERTLVPLAIQPHGEQHAVEEVAEQPEKRHNVALHGERRSYCRRVQHLPVLLDLRSGPDRRRYNLRSGDVQEHIDIEA